MAGPCRQKVCIRLALLRSLLAVMVMVMATGSAPVRSQAPARLFVFLQSELRPNALQKALARALPDMDVLTFGRFRDFKRSVEDSSPEAILAQPAVLNALGLTPVLRGQRGGKTQELFILMAVDEAPNPKSLAELTVGALGLLGRRELPDFVASAAGTKPKKIKRVTKEDDLLPLLQFKSVDAILIPERSSDRLRQKSQLSLASTPLPNLVDLPAVAFASPSAATMLTGSLRKIPKDVLAKIGLEVWQ